MIKKAVLLLGIITFGSAMAMEVGNLAERISQARTMAHHAMSPSILLAQSLGVAGSIEKGFLIGISKGLSPLTNAQLQELVNNLHSAKFKHVCSLEAIALANAIIFSDVQKLSEDLQDKLSILIHALARFNHFGFGDDLISEVIAHPTVIEAFHLLKPEVFSDLSTIGAFNSLFRSSIKKGRISTIALLLKMGADVDFVLDTYFREAPLQLAVNEGQFEVAKMLLKSGANPNIPYDQHNQHTLLTYAQAKRPEMVELLLKYNADPKLTAQRAYIHQELFRLVISIPKDEYAASSRSELNDVHLRKYLAQGNYIHERDMHGNTLLMIAARSNNVSAMHILLGYGAAQTLDAVNKAGKNAFAIAREAGNLEAMQLLANLTNPD